MSMLQSQNYNHTISNSYTRHIPSGSFTTSENMQFENGALKITNNICSLCNMEFENFVQHLVHNNHINKQFLTEEFCSSLALNSSLISSSSLPTSLSSLQTLTFYLKSQKLPLYFKQLYSCHKCRLIFDSIHLLFSHLNKCDSNTLSIKNVDTLNHHIPVINITNDSDSSNGEDDFDGANGKNDAHDSDIEIVAEIAVHKAQSQPDYSHISTAPTTIKALVAKEAIKKPFDPFMKRIDVGENEALILKSASFIRPTSPSKDFTNLSHKNVFSPKPTLESRSNKRLLRNLNKKPEPKRIDYKKKAKSKEECYDSVVHNAANKKKYPRICGTIFKTLKCKFCNRGNFKHEQNLRSHYQNVHNFFSLQPQSESILSRFTFDDMNKYFQFRCLNCLKMFENFTTLSQHRCKYYFKQMHIPKKHSSKNGKVNMMKPILSSVKPETLTDYESESEFFKNIGLVRKDSSPIKCEHIKLHSQESNSSIKTHTDPAGNGSETKDILVQVIPNRYTNNSKKCSKFESNGFLPTSRLNRSVGRVKADLPDDVIISLVSQQTTPNTSRRRHPIKSLKS